MIGDPLAVTLGRWIAGAPPEGASGPALPPDVREQMRDHLLDTIGAMICGGDAPPTRVVAAVRTAPGTFPTISGHGRRALVDAVSIDATAAHALEIDDTEGCDHSGAVVMSVVAALGGGGRGLVEPSCSLDVVGGGDGTVADGDGTGAVGGDPDSAVRVAPDPLAAAAIGYEIGRRVQLAMGGYDAHNDDGWHSTATCGVFAACAAACRLLGLGAAETTSALGLAASRSAGTWAFASDGSMAKQLHPAFAAGAGLESALLARAGATGPTRVFDDVWGGIFTTHARGHADPAALIADLGETWHARHSAIKMHAACRSAHPALDAMLDGLANGRLRADDVEGIELRMPPMLARMIGGLEPGTVAAARMSLPVSIALLLEGRSLLPGAYEAFRDEGVRARTARMRVADGDDGPVLMRIATSTGRIVELERTTARGSADDPYSRAEIRAKFRRITGAVIDEAVQDGWIEAIDRLGKTPPP